MPRARVLLLNAALGPLDYRVPHGMTVEHGSIVVAPLGPRQIVGVVWEEERFDVETMGDNRLRPLLAVLDAPPVRAPLSRLIEWQAGYYIHSPCDVLRIAVSSSSDLVQGRHGAQYRATVVTSEKPNANTS